MSVGPLIFGHSSRWLISKAWGLGGWLVHEPVSRRRGPSSAHHVPTFKRAVELFITLSESEVIE